MMGHIRLGYLPRTRKWIQVLDLIGGGAGTPQVAAATMEACQRGLLKASKDPGLIHAVWLLTQIPLASRGEKFIGELRKLGLKVTDTSGILEIAGAFSAAVDAHLSQIGGRTDLGEMAQMAAAETITALVAPKAESLFGTTPEDVQKALRDFSTTKQFGGLAKEFFARLTRRYLTSFLSKELSNYVGGSSSGRFANVDSSTDFTRALDLHCRQAAVIVERFSGQWVSKTEYLEGITPEKVATKFVPVALKKIRAELAKGAHTDE